MKKLTRLLNKTVLTSAILTSALVTSTAAFADNGTAAISHVIEQYETALNASNTNDIIKLYSKNPTFMPQHAPAQIGQEQVKATYQQVFKAIDLEVDFAIHTIEVNGDTAWARTSSAGKTKILANNAVVTEGNNELFIFKKESGDWKIHQYLFSTNQPRN